MRTRPWWSILAMMLLLACTGCDGEADDDTVTDDDDDDDDDTTEEQPAGCLGEPGPTPGPGICAEEAPCRWDGIGDEARFGFSISAGRDFDQDGVPDFAVGSRGYSQVDQEGRVEIYPGTVATADPMPSPGVFVGLQPLAFTGFSVALVQDMDGDGADDLVAGATGVEDNLGVEVPPNVGAAYLIPGGPLPDPDPESQEIELEPTSVFYGESYYARTGWAMAFAGDVNGDGLGDLLLSGELQDYDSENYQETYRQGRAYLVFGRQDLAGDRVDVADPFDLVAEQFDADGKGFVRRMQFDNVTPDAECPPLEVDVVTRVLNVGQPPQERVAVAALAGPDGHHARFVVLRRPQTEDARDRGDHDAVAPR